MKGYPFEVALTAKLQVRGAILADQVRKLDWRQRRVQKFDKLSSTVREEVRQRIAGDRAPVVADEQQERLGGLTDARRGQ
jgi:mRNA-degrading endonuclease toxin of MazEF toxin-antitoxin module